MTAHGHPCIDVPVFLTAGGVRFLRDPGMAVLGVTRTDLSAMRGFLGGFPEQLHFSEYPDDPTRLSDAEQLAMAAGQICYMSLGRSRTMRAGAGKYLTSIKQEGHGSILEHVCVTFLLYGVSRSFTHELVRHRAGFGFSQVSQRYVDETILRFVMRPEFDRDPALRLQTERGFEESRDQYVNLRERLRVLEAQRGIDPSSRDERRDQRKRLQQAARAILPNQTEAPIIVTANLRAWRHFLEMRASRYAEVEIRKVAVGVYHCLVTLAPLIFDDYHVEQLEDGTQGLTTGYRKV